VQGTTDVGQRIQDVLIETMTLGKGGVLGIPTLGVYPVQNGTLNSKPNWVASQPILAYADAGSVTLQTISPVVARPACSLPCPATLRASSRSNENINAESNLFRRRNS
jgi:hypothetical protein